MPLAAHAKNPAARAQRTQNGPWSPPRPCARYSWSSTTRRTGPVSTRQLLPTTPRFGAKGEPARGENTPRSAKEVFVSSSPPLGQSHQQASKHMFRARSMSSVQWSSSKQHTDTCKVSHDAVKHKSNRTLVLQRSAASPSMPFAVPYAGCLLTGLTATPNKKSTFQYLRGLLLYVWLVCVR